MSRNLPDGDARASTMPVNAAGYCMVHRVEGVYRDGRVELTQAPPEGVGEARVIVVFLPGDDGHVFAEQSIARGAAGAEGAVDDLSNVVDDEGAEDAAVPLATAVVRAIPLELSESTEAPPESPPPLPPAFQPLAPAR